MLHEAGLAGHALEEIGLLDTRNASVDTVLKLAKIAAEAGGLVISRELLTSTLEQLESLSHYELALAVALLLGSETLFEQIDAKYCLRFPNQETQINHSIRRLVAIGAYADALQKSEGLEPDTVSALKFCETHLSSSSVPDYAAISKAINHVDSWARLAFAWVVVDALRRHLLVHAFEIVFGSYKPHKLKASSDQAYRILRQLLLAVDKDGNTPIADDRIDAAFGKLIGEIAHSPDDLSSRFKLEDLLSHKVVGPHGRIKLLRQILACNQPPIVEPQDVASSDIDVERVEKTIRALFDRLHGEGTVITGRMKEPEATFSNGIGDDVLRLAKFVAEEDAENAITEEILNGQMLWLTVVAMAAPHSKTPNADLEFFRIAAARLATSGHQQQARNLIDLILLGTVQRDKAGLREAWFVCADTYSRLRQNHEGLVALSCGMSVQCSIDLPSAVREADVSCRLLRDAGAFDIAEIFHARSGQFLELLGLTKSRAILHKHVGFTIEFGKMKRSIERAQLVDLLARMSTNAEEVLAEHSPAAPMAILLGQVISVAEEAGIQVPIGTLAARDALGAKLTGREADLFQSLVLNQATAAGLLKLHRASTPARYAAYSSYDAKDTAVASRRLLSHKQLSQAERLLALELLCDRAVPLPGWKDKPAPLDLIQTVHETSEWAKILSKRGIDLVVIGLDDGGQSHAVLAREGELLDPSPMPMRFDTKGYRNWSLHYPFQYGIDEKTPNLFHVSTEGLEFPVEPVKATAVVATNPLQLLPPTLYRIGEKFLGAEHPVFAAPSLGWLYAASSSPASTDGRITGWISVADQTGSSLAMVRDRLDEMLKKEHVCLNTGAGLPDGFWGAELSIIVAHGSVLPEGRYFQKVSDEGVLSVTTKDFARAFKNVGVVVLFVCSAGRLDQAPEGESNHGLARELLAQGCSAVIASPWPIDPRVAYHWLPEFMQIWRNGKNVAQATFEANKYVQTKYSSEFRDCLAMTVFGNGLRFRAQ